MHQQSRHEHSDKACCQEHKEASVRQVKRILIELQVDHREGDELGDVVIRNCVILVKVHYGEEIRRHARSIHVLGGVFDDDQCVIHNDQVKRAQNGDCEQGCRERPFIVALVKGILEILALAKRLPSGRVDVRNIQTAKMEAMVWMTVYKTACMIVSEGPIELKMEIIGCSWAPEISLDDQSKMAYSMKWMKA